MRISKVEWIDLVCPDCGAKITIRADEWKKYLEETMDYGNEIICTEKLPGEKEEVEVSYYNFDCPVCGHYIPVNLSALDADRYGFYTSVNADPFYGPSYELSMEDYLKKKFGEEEDETTDTETD